MTRPLSGVILAEKMANGTLTPEEKSRLNAQKKKSQKAVIDFKKTKADNLQQGQEYGRGLSIEFEKEKRVNAGLPEFDIQQTAQTTASNPVKGSKGRRKTHGKSASQILQEAQGSKELGEMRKKSAAQAKAAKAEHNAKTNPDANPKKVHKELKGAEQISAGSTANINEKEVIETLEKNKAASKAPTEFATKKTGAGVPTAPATPVAQKATAEVAGEATSKATAEAVGETASKGVAEVATTGASEAIATTAKSTSKFSKYLKTGGKIALGAAIVGGIIWGISKLFGGSKDEKQKVDTPVAQNPQPKAPKAENPETKPAEETPVQDTDSGTAPVATTTPDESDKVDNTPTKPEDKKVDDKKQPSKVAPAPVAEDSDKAEETGKSDATDKTDKTDKSDKAKNKNKALPKNYTVKKGDNVWNIAKRRLQEVNGKKPTDKEIMEYTNELLKLNKLEYEEDGYTVIIHKGDNIEYAA